MDAGAINRVTGALKKMLDTALRPLNSNAAETVFVGPLDDPGNEGFKVLLFLYRVAVNADLRSRAHVVPAPQPDQPPIVYEGSLPLDLYYLVTAGTPKGGAELDGLSLLGRAIQALNDSPVLTGSGLQNEVVRVSIDPATTDELSRIWQLFPTANYRTSVVYLATPVWIDPARPTEPAAPVVSEPHAVGHKEALR